MKKGMLIFNLIVFSVFSQAQNLETVKTYYDAYTKTKIHEVYTVIKNTPTKQGVYKEYDEQGTLINEKNFANNELNGLSKTYMSAVLAGIFCDSPKDCYGKIAEFYTFKNNMKHGECKQYHYSKGKQLLNWERTYDNDALIKQTEYYDNGQKKSFVQMEGLCNNWYEDGTKSSEFYNKNGEPNGDFVSWYKNGQIKDKGNYIDGLFNDKWITNFEDGTLKYENTYKIIGDKFLSIHVKEFFKNGNIKRERLAQESNKYFETLYDSVSNSKNVETNYVLVEEYKELRLKKDGNEIIYFDNGNKKSETEYKLGIKNGNFKEWFLNGNIKTECSYTNDEKNGKFSTFFENGQIEMSVNYIILNRPPKNGVKDGDAIEYYQNGKSKSIGKYERGGKIGIWQYFKENGSVDYQEEYELPDVLLSKEKKANIEREKALETYQSNVGLINNKVEKVYKLFEVSETEMTNPLTGGKSTIQTIGKKKNIFKAYDIVSKYFVAKISNDEDYLSKAKFSNDYNAFLDRVLLLAETEDTKNIEKELKNIENPNEIITIINK